LKIRLFHDQETDFFHSKEHKDIPSGLILASEHQRNRDIINAKAQELPGTYLVTYTLKPTYSVTLFKTEYRNYRLLHGTVVVKPVSLPFVLMCQRLGNDQVALVQGV